jgi:ankyrin repeat protein
MYRLKNEGKQVFACVLSNPSAGGDTALIIASRNGNSVLVQRLLKSGASTRLRNKDHLSAADVAAARSFSGIAQTLAGA